MADPIWWNLVITLSSCNDVILYVQQTYVLSTRRPTQQRKSINQNSARIIVITSVAIVHLHKQLRESHEVRATNLSYGACGKIIRRLCQTKQQHGTMPQWMPANTKQSHPLLIRGMLTWILAYSILGRKMWFNRRERASKSVRHWRIVWLVYPMMMMVMMVLMIVLMMANDAVDDDRRWFELKRVPV